jgi:hypothetical protein
MGHSMADAQSCKLWAAQAVSQDTPVSDAQHTLLPVQELALVQLIDTPPSAHEDSHVIARPVVPIE